MNHPSIKQLILLFTFTFPVTLIAQTSQQAAFEELGPAMDSQLTAILTVDLGQFDSGQIRQHIEQISNKNNEDDMTFLGQTLSELCDLLTKIRENGGQESNILFRMGTWIPANRILAIRCKTKNELTKVSDLLSSSGNFPKGPTKTIAINNTVFHGPNDSIHKTWIDQLERSASLSTPASNHLLEAREQSENAPIQFTFAISKDQKRALSEFQPAPTGNVFNDLLLSTKNLGWICLAADPKNETAKLTFHLNSSNETDIRSRFNNFFSPLLNDPKTAAIHRQLVPWLNSLNPVFDKNKVQIVFEGKNYRQLWQTMISARIVQLVKGQSLPTQAEIPEFWFQEIMPSLRIVSGIAGG